MRTLTRMFVLVLVLAVTACAAPPGPDPVRERLLAGEHEDPAAHAALPEHVRQSGELVVGADPGHGTPPTQFVDDDGRDAGVESDLRAAVGRVLGVRMRVEQASFDAILPALSSGKFDVGQSNFGVTEPRKHTVDFVTYYRDGFGFVVPTGNPLPPPRSITDLCGLRVGTGAGTSFERTLSEQVGRCAQLGKPPYEVATYSDRVTGLLATTQDKEDVFLLTAMGLQYAAERQPQRFHYLGKINVERVGFALAKGSPLAEPLRRAVQQIIDDGTYQRILGRWGVSSSAQPYSEINPPGLD